MINNNGFATLASDVQRWFSDPAVAELPAIGSVTLDPDSVLRADKVEAHLLHPPGQALVRIAPWAEHLGRVTVTKRASYNYFEVRAVSEPGNSGAGLEVWAHLSFSEVVALGQRAMRLGSDETVSFTAEEIHTAVRAVDHD